MRFSRLLAPTLKEVPSDAETVSHQLMMRGGFIQKVAAGIYTYLPLGLRVVRKIETIIREELNRAGAQEVLMPMVIPGELWEESGRWDEYGKELLRFQDRADRNFCLGPTHEEVITDLVKRTVKSYKQLPMNLYQIQTKFRDEVRPRFGLMRGREFIMKDAYSFHSSIDCLDQEYQSMREAYCRIFDRCQLDYRVVDADSGQMGGSESAEFMVLAETGEDQIVACSQCGYSSNIEVTAVSDGDPCRHCDGGTYSITRGIEVGHVFKLGPKYSQAMGATYLDESGKDAHYEMGCYGIGVGRTAAAAIEQHWDEQGMKWPVSIAPYEVDVIVVNTKDESLLTLGESIYAELQTAGVDVVIDDRPERVGFKFKDAELIGIPIQIVIGKSALAGDIEVRSRLTGEHMTMARDRVVAEVAAMCGRA